ncbi:MAG: SH3 domain-containing protein [Clostridia bacterium]|nr:SH3 domain-containing protein [Clostridia bacterium]
MFTSTQLVAFAKSMVGQPYWYGSCVYKCSESLYSSKKKQYPAHYTSAREAQYRVNIRQKRVCADCVGLIKGFFWTNGGQGVQAYLRSEGDFKNTYASNGMPDLSADGLRSWLTRLGCAHGGIDSLPETPGAMLFASGHVGIYIGGGRAVEARGFSYGIVETEVQKRSWKYWALLPQSILTYEEAHLSMGTIRVENCSSCRLRAQPNTECATLGYARAGDTFPWLGETSAQGWQKVRYASGEAWISGKYARIAEEEQP